MAISFEAIGQKMVTFAAGTGLAEGKVCKISANGTVGPCSEEGFFISRRIKIMARMTAASPAIGQAYRTPSMPNASGMSLP